MRHLTLALILIVATSCPVAAFAADVPPQAPAAPPAGDPTAPATASGPGVPAAPGPPPTPSIAERITNLQQARLDLIERCKSGIAQHDGAIAALQSLAGQP